MPRLFDIFSTPSSPSSSGVVITICGWQVVARHDVAADVQVEELIGAAELDVRSERDRVVRLDKRIEKLVHRDRLAAVEALAEVAPLEHLRDVVRRRQLDQPVASEGNQPAAVEFDHGLHRIEQLEDLRLVRLGVALDLVVVSGGRVFDRPLGSPIIAVKSPTTKTTRVPEVLEVLHLADQHRVAQVEVGRVGSKPTLTTSGRRSASRARRSSSRTTSTQP